MGSETTRRQLRVGGEQRAQHFAENIVLDIRVRNVVCPLELDADREVITAVPRSKSACPCMPRTLQEWHELQQRTVTANQQVR